MTFCAKYIALILTDAELISLSLALLSPRTQFLVVTAH